MNPDGSCCLNILENIINDLEKNVNFDEMCVVNSFNHTCWNF